MVVKFFFSYFGGKARDMKKIQPFVFLDDIDTICEPFCGTCSFSTHQDEKYKLILNDLDSNLMSFLEDVKEGLFPEYVRFFNHEIHKYKIHGAPTPKWHELKRNKEKSLREWFLMRRASRGGEMLNLGVKKMVLEDYLDIETIIRADRVNLISGDYLKIFEKVKNDDKCFVFLDPPYLDSCNLAYSAHNGKSTDDNMVIKDKTKMFIDIMEFIKTAKCRIMLIINKNSITEFLFKDNIVGEYAKRYDVSGRRTSHLVVTNY